MLYYPSSQRLSTWNRIVLPVLALIVVSGAILTATGLKGLQLLDFLYIFSYIKVSSPPPAFSIRVFVASSADPPLSVTGRG